MSQGGYEQIPGTGAESLDLADPAGYTSQFSNQYFNQLPSMFSSALNPTDYGGQQRQFLNNFGGLTGAITEATSPLSKQLGEQVDFYTGRATDQLGQQFSNLNSLYSSGFGKTAGEAAGQIAGQAGTQLAQAQLGMLSPLASQSMAGIQQGDLAQRQMAGSLLGYGSQMYNPVYSSPMFGYQPSGWENFLSGATQGTGLLGNIFGLFG